MDLLFYMRRVESLATSFYKIELDINNDTGKLILNEKKKHVFNIQTLYLEAIFDDAIFCSFIDNVLRKRCIIPMPVSYLEQITFVNRQ